ncbi:ankyrin repeat domain-containing protein 6-like [Tropilaelaps mercedesae]|uniref:Ankyrin repeat domain-containing protein 6-like n=1 Tax=Tropilaelaps mercedesae TaxID=418985 RepID=A0A1V9XTC8_9ACAR|nr:ankyrin repeat domain-containing protein 6-like [Tropilaelaps mercedesae]
MRKRKLTKILLESAAAVHAKNDQGESPLDIARRKQFPELEEMLLNPPKRPVEIETDRDERDGKGRKREKDPNTSTSSGKPGGNNSASRRKKKTKTKNDSGILMQRSKSLPTAVPIGPYGCPHSPHDMAGFPTPKIETLPPDPLAKGEQYYLDLAGNIRKGPVGRGYTCYCVPFFKNFETRLEADKQELNEKIGESQQNIEKKLRTLERNTISQLQSLDLMPRDANYNHDDQQVNIVDEVDDNADHSLEAFAEAKIGRRTSPHERNSPPPQTEQPENSSTVNESRWSKLMECRATLSLKINESSNESSEDDDEVDVERRPGSFEPVAVQPMPVLLHRTRPLSSSYLHLPNANLNEIGLPPPNSIDISARTISRIERRPVSSFGTREATAGRSPSLLDSNGTPPPSTIGTNVPPDDPSLKKPFCRPPRPPSYQTHMERVFRPTQSTVQPLSATYGSQPRPASTPPKAAASTQIALPTLNLHTSSLSTKAPNRVSLLLSNGTTSGTVMSKGDLGGLTEIRTSMQNLSAYIPSGPPQLSFSYTNKAVTPNPSLNVSSHSGINKNASSNTLNGNVSIDKTPVRQSAVSSPRSQRYIMSSEV